MTPTGTGKWTFDTQPAVGDWSTLGVGTGAGSFVFPTDLDTDIQAQDATTITSALGSSSTQPPSINNVARRNTSATQGLYIQMKPDTAGYVVLMATLTNNTGSTVPFLNVSYTFGLSIPVGTVAAEEIPGWRSFYSLTGLPGSWQPIPAFTTGTPSVLSAALNLGPWANGSRIYLLWADDNANAATTAPNVEGAYLLDNFEAVPAFGREPVLGTFISDATGFIADIADGDAALSVNQSTIKATLNSTDITPQVSKTGSDIRIAFNGSALPVGSTNTVVFAFSNNNSPAKSYSITRTFVVTPYLVIPASLAVTGVNTSSPGFKVRVSQIAAARSPGDLNSIENAEKQLINGFIDPATGQPYPNDADLTAAVNGVFNVTGIINWNQDAPTSAGSFTDLTVPPFTDDPIPGIPGVNPANVNDNIASEILTFLDLKAGTYHMGVNSDDGFKVTVGLNPRDALSLVLGSFNTGRGVADSLFDFVVEKDGIYPFRLIWWEGTGGAALEWFTVDAFGQKILINDRSNPAAVKAYSTGPAGPFYVKAISPTAFTTNALGDFVFNAILADGSTAIQASTVKLFVNDQAVNATVNKPAGSSDTTVTFDPAGVLAPETLLNVKLVYGDGTTLVTNSFSIKVKPLLLIALDDATIWSYDRSGLDLGTAWRDKAYNDSAWPTGAALIADDTASVEPIRTPISRSTDDEVPVHITTFYFRHHFNFTGNPAAVNLLLRHVIDDGGVFYLNGVEIHRFGLAAGLAYDVNTFFTSHENVWEGPFAVSKAALITGDNVLAVEIHQTDAASTDIVFGAELMAVTDTTAGPARFDSVVPAMNAREVPTNTVVEIRLVDGTTRIDTNSIKLTINGSPVTPNISRATGSISTLVSYAPAAGFVDGSTVNVGLTFGDTAFPANVVTTNIIFNVLPKFDVVVGINDTQMWKYDNSGLNLGTAWKEKAYDDSTWAEGPALLADETGATPEPIRTTVSRFNNDGIHVTTTYFRTHFNFTGDPATARLRIRHIVDDGAVFYLNGVEVLRFGLAAGNSFDFATFFGDHESSGLVAPAEISAASLVQGDNVLAVEVHQATIDSSDMVFGLELQRVTSAPPAVQPKFNTAALVNGQLSLSWTGTGTLEETTSLTPPANWQSSANQSNPQNVTTTGTKFYRIKQ